MANLAFKLSTGESLRNQFGIFGRRGTYGFLDTSATACWAIKCHSTAEPIILWHFVRHWRVVTEVQFLNQCRLSERKGVVGGACSNPPTQLLVICNVLPSHQGRTAGNIPDRSSRSPEFWYAKRIDGTFPCLSALRRRDFDGAGPIREQANLRRRLRSVLQPH